MHRHAIGVLLMVITYPVVDLRVSVHQLQSASTWIAIERRLRVWPDRGYLRPNSTVPATSRGTRFTRGMCRLVGGWQCLAIAGSEYEISGLLPTDK